eukprot:2073055-Ditylum_brightwellii.AAC.1
MRPESIPGGCAEPGNVSLEFFLWSNPDTKDVINVSDIVDQKMVEELEHFVFVDCIKQCGPGNCRWCVHGCAGNFLPDCASKLEYVPAHEQVGADFSHDCICVDVGVHRDSICSEELGIV